MPILPLDHPDPFAATLGVMLYPGADDDPPAGRPSCPRIPLKAFLAKSGLTEAQLSKNPYGHDLVPRQ
jgi:hypothetical protein